MLTRICMPRRYINLSKSMLTRILLILRGLILYLMSSRLILLGHDELTAALSRLYLCGRRIDKMFTVSHRLCMLKGFDYCDLCGR